MLRVTTSLIALLTVLSACAHVGSTFDLQKASQLQPGISTENDAIALLGKPVAMKKDESGSNDKLMWFYAYGTAIATGGSSKLVILFDGNGTMIRVLERAEI